MSARPLRVLHVMPFYDPAIFWGGPVFWARALFKRLAAREDMEVRVLTTDAAGPKPSERVGMGPNPVQFPGYTVHYCRRWYGRDIAPALPLRLIGAVRWADVVHLSMTYSFPTLPAMALARLFGRPLVWSPHGALQATAEWEAARSRAKGGFEWACRRLMPRGTVLRVTAEAERALSLQRMPGYATELIPNAVDPVPEATRDWRPGGAMRLLCLGRIHPKKGIDILIEALTHLPPHVTLEVCGRGERAHEEALEAQVAALGLGERVRFSGEVEGAEKAAAFHRADAFVLATHSENFGNVIAESLAHGVPVITTRGAPWPELEPRGAGLWIENGVAPVAAAIEEIAARDLPAMGAAGRRWMSEDFSPEATAERMAALFHRLAAPRLARSRG